MMRRGIGVLCALGVLAVGSGRETRAAQPPSQGYPADRVPRALAAAVHRAEAGMLALQGSLLRRLQAATADGSAAALAVCAVEAGAIRDRVMKEQGIVLGRTSHALRNASNRAPAWAARLVTESAGRAARECEQRVFDLGDRVGVIRPIPTGLICTNCHGPAGALSSEVRAALRQRYPEDRATGFGEGDLRGWIWAEVPKGVAPRR
jgi:hypothetical protein